MKSNQVGVLTGTEGDATPFTDVTVANVSTTLHKIGFQKHGNEVMYSGHTGRMLNTKVRGEPSRRWKGSLKTLSSCLPSSTARQKSTSLSARPSLISIPSRYRRALRKEVRQTLTGLFGAP